jgi:hypothetical protein
VRAKIGNHFFASSSYVVEEMDLWANSGTENGAQFEIE